MIDTSDVGLVDLDGGPGGAYFSQTGPSNARDIKTGPSNARDIRVADLMIETGTSLAGEAPLGLSGSIYLSGQ